MNRFLSKISAPLLVGSILALGALAFPTHAHAVDLDGSRYFFRGTSGVLPMQVAAVPEEEDRATGDDGKEEAANIPHMRLTFSNGAVTECRSSDEFPHGSPEEIAARLTGRVLTVNDTGKLTASLPDYLTPGSPPMTVEWVLGATEAHTPRSGCDYSGGNGWEMSAVLERGNLPLPGRTVTIVSADVIRKAPYARADVPAASAPDPGTLVVQFAGGWEARCASGWNSFKIADNAGLLKSLTTTLWGKTKTNPAVATVGEDGSFAFVSDALRVSMTGGAVSTSDGVRLGSLPSPCLTNAAVQAGDMTADTYPVAGVDYLP